MTEHVLEHLKGGKFNLYICWFNKPTNDFTILIRLCSNTIFSMFILGFFHRDLMRGNPWMQLVRRLEIKTYVWNPK